MFAYALPLQDTAKNTAGALAIVAATIASLSAIFIMLRKARRARPIAWFERRLITMPRDERRAAANKRIIVIVNAAVIDAQAPLVESIGLFREENAAQHADVVIQLDELTRNVADVSKRVGQLEKPIKALAPPHPPEHT